MRQADSFMAGAGGSPTFTGAGSILRRKCACGKVNAGGGECGACSRSRGAASTQAASAGAHDTADAQHAHGQPLDAGARALMESRFGRDFSDVRVHTDERADASARSLNAVAYTLGRDIVFAEGHYNPRSAEGRFVLAHELAHVAQQGASHAARGGGGFGVGASAEHERQANAAASAVHLGARAPHVAQGAGPAVMLLTPAEFRKQLGATKEQEAAINSLFADKTFLELWDYLKTCPATPKQDLGPLALKVTPGLKIRGAERFGGYSPATQTLEINPTKPEHTSNTAELVDTIVHELIHAVDDLKDVCKAAGSKDAPLAGAGTQVGPKRATVAGTAQETKLMEELGPGASNPCEEFIDINKAAQQMIVNIIKHNIEVTGLGRPTVTFVNEILRQDPKAMAAYVKCRDVACANTDAAKRSAAIAACSADIIAKFMPKSLKPTPKPKTPTKPVIKTPKKIETP